jgi:hypothetical protein
MMSDRFSLNERIAALLRKGSPIPDAVPSPAPSVDQPIFDEAVLEESVIESPIVGGDKLQALRTALAGDLSEPPVISTNTETSPPAFFDKSTNEEPADQTPVDAPADAGNTDKLQVTIAEILIEPPVISTNTETSPPAFFDEPTNEEPAEQTHAPADAGNTAIRAERAKSVLDGLNLDTAIRLRWVLRDIRAKRTNLSPISQNDLMALIELGLIEILNDEPTLTPEGMRAIAYWTGPDGGERGRINGLRV